MLKQLHLLFLLQADTSSQFLAQTGELITFLVREGASFKFSCHNSHISFSLTVEAQLLTFFAMAGKTLHLPWQNKHPFRPSFSKQVNHHTFLALPLTLTNQTHILTTLTKHMKRFLAFFAQHVNCFAFIATGFVNFRSLCQALNWFTSFSKRHTFFFPLLDAAYS